jgi:hypothetical protein
MAKQSTKVASDLWYHAVASSGMWPLGHNRHANTVTREKRPNRTGVVRAIAEFVKSRGARYIGRHEHLPILSVSSYETRWLGRRWPPTLPLSPLSPGLHHPFCLCVFWVPLAPGRSFDGRAMVLGIPRVNVKKRSLVRICLLNQGFSLVRKLCSER